MAFWVTTYSTRPLETDGLRVVVDLNAGCTESGGLGDEMYGGRLSQTTDDKRV